MSKSYRYISKSVTPKDQLQQTPRYKSTIKIQEQIIRKLELVLQESEKEKEERVIPSTPRLKTATIDTESNGRLERENEDLSRRIRELERDLRDAKAAGTGITVDDTLADFKRELEEERDR